MRVCVRDRESDTECVCLCEKERENKRERAILFASMRRNVICASVFECVCVCVNVCVREKERLRPCVLEPKLTQNEVVMKLFL